MLSSYSIDNNEAEDVNTLSLGPDFTDMICLTHSEVYQILANKIHSSNRTSSYSKTLEYLKRFSPAEEEKCAVTTELRQALESYERRTEKGMQSLHPYEIVSLCDLMQTDSTVDEAIALIPSLSRRFNENDIESMLELVRKSYASR
mmetsp:Transcript_11384/g.16935  ORF Transcript_11384/g.16935 Transcript_11384/m.16935 type:complete len:146 (+) Transcript_11384:22-459(+)|eukprot:CAMPEP_0171462780 /NCGR_PEP_ID=MMETSP0945-20130129/6676_1 /TAXON_ID=109269 /ORGANISM="Vaucheria litorea, Strain CCMP2940" /LENGTH=145 /DNA_ID=CAMNT_0011989365 /DNA_START=22 /DNA_END=459 /DNA_ORIENTATION=-